MYNYLESIKDDITTYMNDYVELTDYNSIEELEEYLNDTLWTEDSVTGNASGSYTFNSAKAEENLNGNWDLVKEVCREFFIEDPFEKGAEFIDVSIRCYLLSSAIAEIMEDIRNDFEELFDGQMDDDCLTA